LGAAATLPKTATGGWFCVSWWVWAIIAWLVASVAFAVFIARFIAVGRAHARSPVEDEILIDLTAPEPGLGGAEAPIAPATPDAPAGAAPPAGDRTTPGSTPARSV
jgi:hypothetical protein